MKDRIIILTAILLMALTACSNDEPSYNAELPAKISSFVSEYYPGLTVADYTQTSAGYEVVLKDGPTITFDKAYAWTTIDGNGSTLGQQLLYDQLPTGCYDYLQQTSSLNQVFAISRDSKAYTIKLLTDSYVYHLD